MALDPPIDASAEAVREVLAPLRSDFSVALLSAGNAFAVGAVIRVAHNFLAREVFLVGTEPFYAKASMGMHKYETIVRVADGRGLLEAVRGRPVWAVEKIRVVGATAVSEADLLAHVDTKNGAFNAPGKPYRPGDYETVASNGRIHEEMRRLAANIEQRIETETAQREKQPIPGRQ